MTQIEHRHKRIHRLLIVPPQSGEKDQFYCTVYYPTLNSNCEAQGVSKNLEKLKKMMVFEAKINAWAI
jgi:hypothetical protein